MESNAKPVNDQDTAALDLLDNHRNAHRVFRGPRSRRDLVNPFRHIPWGYDDIIDEEAALGQSTRQDKIPEPRKFGFGIGRFSRQWPFHEKPFTLVNQFQRTMCTCWINVLLLCLPVGQYFHIVNKPSTATFVLNYVAQFPLWYMCDYALEEIQKYVGRTLSDILDILTSNTVQVINTLLLLRAREVSLLQTSLIGGILSNILFLLGLSYVLGGVKNHEQSFNRIGAQGSSSLLSIAATSILIPTVAKHLNQTTQRGLVLQSHGVAFVLLFVYFTYTICQMVTHKEEYRESGREGRLTAPNRLYRRTGIDCLNRRASCHQCDHKGAIEVVQHTQGTAEVPAKMARVEIKGVHLHLCVALLVFAASIAGLYFSIDATVASISTLTEHTTLSPTFVGLVLLPIPNCDFAPISLAIEDYVEQTMKYTVGRSIQTALLVEPLAVLVAWGQHIEGVSLAFDGFEVVSLFTTILLLNFLIIDARVHWVHGVLLLSDFALIAIAAYFVMPESR